MSDQKGWSCPDLIRWISMELKTGLKDELKITFQMLDGNKDGFVSRRDCVTVLTHAIGNPLNHR